MDDQYGNIIPEDLMLLPDYTYLIPKDIATVFAASWYECQSILLVSAAAIDYLSETDPIDAGLTLENETIQRIDDVLKRGNKTDNFYHA